MADPKADLELQAISTLLTVLAPLESTARYNVIEYVCKRLGIATFRVARLLKRLSFGALCYRIEITEEK